MISGLNLILPAVFELIAQQNWEQLHPRKRLLLTLARFVLKRCCRNSAITYAQMVLSVGVTSSTWPTLSLFS